MKQGKWITFYKDTKEICVIEHYKDDKLDGKRIVYTDFNNNLIKSSITFKDGKKVVNFCAARIIVAAKSAVNICSVNNAPVGVNSNIKSIPFANLRT